ncbi:MAG: DMT family transporter [Chloroflexi bacterium]|nr:DMT family transporter [Chloroflexota bacterium]MDA1002917.1 DMT family transporter [Chloroflexota bacterium]
MLASASYGVGAVYLRRRLLGVDSMVLAGLQSVIAFALLTAVLAFVEGVPDLPALSARVALAAGGLAVLSSGIAIVIYYWLLRNLHAAQAALVTYLVPVTAVFWGWFVLDERVGGAVVPGLVLIMTGIYLVNRRPRAAGLPPGATPTSAPVASPPARERGG